MTAEFVFPDRVVIDTKLNKLTFGVKNLEGFLTTVGTEAGPARFVVREDLPGADDLELIQRIRRIGEIRFKILQELPRLRVKAEIYSQMQKALVALAGIERTKDQLSAPLYEMAQRLAERSIKEQAQRLEALNPAKAERPQIKELAQATVADREVPIEEALKVEKEGRKQVFLTEQGFEIDGELIELSPRQAEIFKTLLMHNGKAIKADQLALEAFNIKSAIEADVRHRFEGLAVKINKVAGQEIATKGHRQYTIEGLDFAGFRFEDGEVLTKDRAQVLLKLWPFSQDHIVSKESLVRFRNKGVVNYDTESWTMGAIQRTRVHIRSKGYQLRFDKAHDGYFVERVVIPSVDVLVEQVREEIQTLEAEEEDFPEVEQALVSDEIAGKISSLILQRDKTRIIFANGKTFEFTLSDYDKQVFGRLLNAFLHKEDTTLSQEEVSELTAGAIDMIEEILTTPQPTLYLDKESEDKSYLVTWLLTENALEGSTLFQFLSEPVERIHQLDRHQLSAAWKQCRAPANLLPDEKVQRAVQETAEYLRLRREQGEGLPGVPIIEVVLQRDQAAEAVVDAAAQPPVKEPGLSVAEEARRMREETKQREKQGKYRALERRFKDIDIDKELDVIFESIVEAKFAELVTGPHLTRDFHNLTNTYMDWAIENDYIKPQRGRDRQPMLTHNDIAVLIFIKEYGAIQRNLIRDLNDKVKERRVVWLKKKAKEAEDRKKAEAAKNLHAGK